MIQVVERTFDVLELLAKEKTPLSNTDIAQKMGISIQTANNLLRTLYLRAYVSQDESRNYRLGAQCIYLGSFADRWRYMREKLTEPLKKLAVESSFATFCGVVENDKLLCLIYHSPGEETAFPPEQQWWDELHSTACGRILLTSMSKTERSKLFARTMRRKMTEATVIDIDELEKVCAKVEKDGYSEVCNESRQGVSSLAIPLRDISGRVFAGLAISSDNSKWKTVPFERKLNFLTDTREKLESY